MGPVSTPVRANPSNIWNSRNVLSEQCNGAMSKTAKRQLKSVHQNDIYCGAHYLVDTSSISNCAFLLSLLAFKKGCGQISRGCTWALHISSLPIVGQHCSTKLLHLGIFLVLLPHIEQCDNREFVIVKRWQTFGSLLPSSSWTQTACGLIVALFSSRMCLKFLCVKFVWRHFSCTLHRGRFSFPHEQKVFKTRDRVEPFLCSG